MMKSRIRQIAVEVVVTNPDSETTKFMTMVYAVGGIRKFKIDNKSVERTISDIIETETGFKLYITNENTTQEWITLHSKERVTVFNFID